MSDELKPCPFCGGEAHFERRGTPRQSCIVSCLDCGATLSSPDSDWNSGSSWNRRTPTTLPPSERAEGERIAELEKQLAAVTAERDAMIAVDDAEYVEFERAKDEARRDGLAWAAGRALGFASRPENIMAMAKFVEFANILNAEAGPPKPASDHIPAAPPEQADREKAACEADELALLRQSLAAAVVVRRNMEAELRRLRDAVLHMTWCQECAEVSTGCPEMSDLIAELRDRKETP